MVEKVKELHPPRGLARIGFRLPIQLYKLGMGGLFGTRLLMLTHIGRKSGLKRQTVLEVVRHDKTKNEFIIAAGFGRKSDWVQNILVHPEVTVRCGRKDWDMKANFLSPEECGQEMVDYAHRYPLTMRELQKFMGFKVDGTDEDIYAMGKMLALVSLRPVGE